MAQVLIREVLQDPLVMSLARAMAAANEKAREFGVDVAQSLVSITQQMMDTESVWRINYGPKDYVNRRGGDLIVYVDTHDATVKRVLRGQ
jgi:hypothetical protein